MGKHSTITLTPSQAPKPGSLAPTDIKVLEAEASIKILSWRVAMDVLPSYAHSPHNPGGLINGRISGAVMTPSPLQSPSRAWTHLPT